MKPHRDELQTTQRLRVGMVGLVAVVLLIALAGWIIGSTRRDAPANGTTEIAVNLATDNAAAAAAEPLAELGATPGSVNDQVATAR